jgi:probable rRNA maturation factor
VAARSPRLSVALRGSARKVRPHVVRELARQLRRAMRAAAADGEVVLSLTDDREILALNRTYADEDHATDVLSFSPAEATVLPLGIRHGAGPEPPPVLGDIVISVPTATRQARAGGRTLTAELVHLAVHGLAHLLGYDHATPAEERVMFGFETKLRAQSVGRGPVARVRRPPR